MLQLQGQPNIIRGASFEWDDDNRYKNLIKHGVTEEEAESVFLDKQLVVAWSLQVNYLEKRLIAIGKSRLNRNLLIVFTIRSNQIRVISARRTRKKEMQLYEKKTSFA